MNVFFINLWWLIKWIPRVLGFEIFTFGNIFRVYETIEFPKITNFNKILRPDTFMPISPCVYSVYSFQDVIENPQSLCLTYFVIPHVIFKIGLIRLGNEGEQSIVRNGDYDFIEVF